jgi:hypothetical protein
MLGKKAIQRLFKAGYKPKKGTFRAMKRGSSTRRSRGGQQNQQDQQNQQEQQNE